MQLPEPWLCRSVGAEGFPTLVLFDGEPSKFKLYSGERTKKAMAAFLQEEIKVPTPGNINVNLGFFTGRFSTVTDRFLGLGAGFLNRGGKMG